MDINTKGSLCSRCKAIALNDLLQKGYKPWKESDESELSLSIPWYSSLAELISLSPSDCPLCKLVRQGLDAFCTSEASEQEANGDIPPRGLHEIEAEDPLRRIDGYVNFPMTMSLRLCTSLSTMDYDSVQDLTPGTGSDRSCQVKKHANALLAISISSGVSWGLTPQAEFRIVTGYDDPSAEIILGRTVAQIPDGEQAFSVIKGWIQRLSVFDSDSKVESTAKYVALSHCWGQGTPFATTTKNLCDRKREIRISDMPMAFQHAILITRRLGLRYIWIDSLCIIQDDVHDWQVEAGRMVAVYMDAFVVIGASNSSADDCGFLSPRESGDRIHFAGRMHDGQASNLDLFLLPPARGRWTSGQDPLSQEPLQTRAWCLQERYLARRILLYGGEQLFWECQSVSRAEDGDIAPYNLHHLDRLQKTAASDVTIFSPRPQGDSQVNYRGWYKMVEEYMHRRISVPSDRLPALSGLADAITQKSKDADLAGIWKKGLIEGLLWCGTSDEQPLKKPATYRAPSWSWVSVDGTVQFIVYNFVERCRWKRAIANYEPLATFVDSNIEAAGPDPYGCVLNGGHLRLNAPLLPVKGIYPADDRPPSSDVLMVPLRNPILDKVVEVVVGDKSFYLHGALDVISEAQMQVQQQQLFVLLLARLPDGNTGFSPFMDHRFGLLVRPIERDDKVYERVGIIDSPILEPDRGGGGMRMWMWMVILRILERSLRFLERFLPPEDKKFPISFLTPRLFEPARVLKEEPEEEMPADPWQEVRQHSVTITLV